MGSFQGPGQGWCSAVERQNQRALDGRVQRLAWGGVTLGTLAQIIIQPRRWISFNTQSQDPSLNRAINPLQVHLKEVLKEIGPLPRNPGKGFVVLWKGPGQEVQGLVLCPSIALL